MIVKNNTNVEQVIMLTDRYGTSYTVYLPAGRSTEIEPVQYTKKLFELLDKGILVDVASTGSAPKIVIPVEIAKEPRESECACDVPDVVEPVVTDESPKETVKDHEPVVSETETSVYICEVCGAEYASPKGLTRHMNKEHPEYNKED